MTAYFAHIWRLRYFWMALVRVDLRRRYRRSSLGLGWSLLQPVMMTAVLCTMFSQLLHADIKTYAPFLLVGLTFWNFVVGSVNQGCQCFFQGESYIRQQPAPLAIYPLRTTLGAAIHLLLGLLVVLGFVWCIHGLSNLPALVSLGPTLVMLFIMGWSMATCMGVVNVIFQDTQHLIEVVLQALFYLTPIMYPANMLESHRHLTRFVALNPLAAFVDLLRKPILEGQIPATSTYLVALTATCIAAGLAGLTLKRVERRMIFYL